MNFYDLINAEAQKANGINDSVEALIADNSNPLDTPERIRAQAEGSFILDKWLRSFGVNLNYNYEKEAHGRSRCLCWSSYSRWYGKEG